MEIASSPNFLDSQYPNLIDTKKFGYTASCGPMPTAGSDTEEDTAMRCRALVRIYAMDANGKPNSRRFAEEVLDTGYTRWNNIERSGKLSIDMARTIYRAIPEVSLDWLYRGRDDAMPRTLSAEFLKAFREEIAEAKEAARSAKKGRSAA